MRAAARVRPDIDRASHRFEPELPRPAEEARGPIVAGGQRTATELRRLRSAGTCWAARRREGLPDPGGNVERDLELHRSLGGFPAEVVLELVDRGELSGTVLEALSPTPLLAAAALILTPGHWSASSPYGRPPIECGVPWRPTSLRRAVREKPAAILMSAGPPFSDLGGKHRRRILGQLATAVRAGAVLWVHVPDGRRGVSLPGGVRCAEAGGTDWGRLLRYEGGAPPSDPRRFLHLAIRRILRDGAPRYRRALWHAAAREQDQDPALRSWAKHVRTLDRPPPGAHRRLTLGLVPVFERRLREKLEAFRRGRYAPKPVKTVPVKKASGKSRPIDIYGIDDRVLLGALALMLGEHTRGVLTAAAVGGVPGVKIRRTVQDVQRRLSRPGTHHLTTDIRDLFPTLPHFLIHESLRRHLPRDLDDTCLQTATGRSTDRGISQGSPLSVLVANLALHDLVDTRIRGVCYFRYIDDILFLGTPAEVQAAHDLTVEVLAEAGMELAAHKTSEVQQGPLAYLGLRITPDNIGLTPGRVDEICRKVEEADDPADTAAATIRLYGGILSPPELEGLKRALEALPGVGEIPRPRTAKAETTDVLVPAEPSGAPPLQEGRPTAGDAGAHDAPGPSVELGTRSRGAGRPAPLTPFAELDIRCPLVVGGTIGLVADNRFAVVARFAPHLLGALQDFGDLRGEPGRRPGRIAVLGFLGQVVQDGDAGPCLEPLPFYRSSARPTRYVGDLSIWGDEPLLAAVDEGDGAFVADLFMIMGLGGAEFWRVLADLCRRTTRGEYDAVLLQAMDFFPGEELAGPGGPPLEPGEVDCRDGQVAGVLRVIHAADRCRLLHGFRPTILFEGQVDEDLPGRVSGAVELNARTDQVLHLRVDRRRETGAGPVIRPVTRVEDHYRVDAYEGGRRVVAARAGALVGARESSFRRSGLRRGCLDQPARDFRLAARHPELMERALAIPIGERWATFSRPEVAALVRSHYRPGAFDWVHGHDTSSFHPARIPELTLSRRLVSLRNPGQGPDDPSEGKRLEEEYLGLLCERLGMEQVAGSGSGLVRCDLRDDLMVGEYKGTWSDRFDLQCGVVGKIEAWSESEMKEPFIVIEFWSDERRVFLIREETSDGEVPPACRSRRIRATEPEGTRLRFLPSDRCIWTVVSLEAFERYRRGLRRAERGAGTPVVAE